MALLARENHSLLNLLHEIETETQFTGALCHYYKWQRLAINTITRQTHFLDAILVSWSFEYILSRLLFNLLAIFFVTYDQDSQ